jgi:hypothetical protein
MLNRSAKPLALLQEPLLGKAASEVLAIEALTNEMQQVAGTLAEPLSRLANGTRNGKKGGAWADSLLQCMQEPLRVLHDWVLTGETQESDLIDQDLLADFIDFIAMAKSLAEFQAQAVPGRLLHLLGLGALRSRLESHVGLEPALVIELPSAFEGLTTEEIATLCGLKLTTVRNAVSRREMAYSKKTGVPLDEALDWMVQRSGFLYPHINAATWERRINGRLANAWLRQCKTVSFERSISRLRLSLWFLKSGGQRIALNAEGVRNCVVLLPAIDVTAFADIGLERLEDRSVDPAAEMHRDALSLAPGQTLWQCQVPTLQVLDALVERLGSNQPLRP